jgi:hypothetical protein
VQICKKLEELRTRTQTNSVDIDRSCGLSTERRREVKVCKNVMDRKSRVVRIFLLRSVFNTTTSQCTDSDRSFCDVDLQLERKIIAFVEDE